MVYRVLPLLYLNYLQTKQYHTIPIGTLDLEQELLQLKEELARAAEEKFTSQQALKASNHKLQQALEYNKELEALLIEGKSPHQFNTVTIKSATQIDFVSIREIVYCSADVVYTDVYLENGNVITATKCLSTFERCLNSHHFFRISRSHLIHKDHIVSFRKDTNKITLTGGIVLDVARRRRVEFLRELE